MTDQLALLLDREAVRDVVLDLFNGTATTIVTGVVSMASACMVLLLSSQDL